MAQLENATQKFESKDGTKLASLQCHVCEETGKQYTLWSDIQKAFNGIDYLEVQDEYAVLFMTANDGELYAMIQDHLICVNLKVQ